MVRPETETILGGRMRSRLISRYVPRNKLMVIRRSFDKHNGDSITFHPFPVDIVIKLRCW